ncbi:MAG: TlpA family protein disulfide reductase [Phycisphaerae bacterium]
MKLKLLGLAGLATVTIAAIAFTNEQHLVLMTDAVGKGQEAPTFTTTAIGGDKVDFPKAYKGKIVLIDFWATWCPPCVREIPNLVKVHDKYVGDDFAVIGVSLDESRNRSEDRVKEFAAKKEMKWLNIYTDSNEIAGAYHISAIPTPILIDADTGKVLERGGSLKGKSLEDQVKKYVDAKVEEKEQKKEEEKKEE